ncbi:non-specific lipid-transfer protein 1-like [Cornus florida]|uniref:non-specific lipid-transfer protein 1-like n=1 Tax=Cornus florida TaxID=4283 RepID=UPI00289A46E8|nr:non-specific lipid-transfer protein 1-like [Cornus florida]
MASSGRMLKVAVLVVMCMVVAAPQAQAAAAVTCGEVATYLAPCGATVAYPVASQFCCTGVKTLFGFEQTTLPQRQDACKCLKSATGAISTMDIGFVFKVLKLCGAKIPSISKTTDCSKYTSLHSFILHVQSYSCVANLNVLYIFWLDKLMLILCFFN